MADGMTSYERVYNALFKTSTCQDIWNAAFKEIDTIALQKVNWQLRLSEDTATPEPIFIFNCNGIQWSGNGLQTCELNARQFLSSENAKKVIDLHFGPNLDVKTFNCKRDIVIRGGYLTRKDRHGDRDRVHQDGFYTFLIERFEVETKESLAAATRRLKQELAKLQTSEEFIKARHEALVGFCKDTITKALLPWHTMDQQVLQDAWDQFVCTAIMRT